MTAIDIPHNYFEGLEKSEPVYFESHNVKPPPGAQGAARIEPTLVIPPLNTRSDFSSLPVYQVSEHPGLSALSQEPLEEIFNWHKGAYDKDKNKFVTDEKMRKIIGNLATPGNQMLCGSCWAISTAGIVADNFVISGVVDWNPNLSTTYSLSCYPQLRCKGGNPAKLLEDISKNGIVTNHCIDYSWCAENQYCNGDAKKHFKTSAHPDLNSLIPTCGCYDNGEFYKYYVDDNPGPQRLTINNDKERREMKAHIRHRGPVLGAFLVFSNFMRGYFSKGIPNKGIYLEDAVYNSDGTVTYQKLDAASEYRGSHAVAIIGWGIEKDVQIDASGTKKDVPYWYVRNSWTSKWADDGYFKMAMHPFNRYSQFDQTITIRSPKGMVQSGGIIIFRTSKPPKKIKMNQTAQRFQGQKRIEPPSYYKSESIEKRVIEDPKPGPKPGPKPEDGEERSNLKRYLIILFFVLLILALIVFLINRYTSKAQPMSQPRPQPMSRPMTGGPRPGPMTGGPRPGPMTGGPRPQPMTGGPRPQPMIRPMSQPMTGGPRPQPMIRPMMGGPPMAKITQSVKNYWK